MPKAPHEEAVDEFIAADNAYKDLEQRMLSGELVVELLQRARNADRIRSEWQTLMGQLRSSLEERNRALRNAKDEMRKLVRPEVQTSWRGPDGKPESRSYGPLTVNTTTFRGFDAESLFNLARKHGLEERVLSLTSMNSKTGLMEPVVKQVWDIKYEDLAMWLRQNALTDIFNGAYDEKEGTPQVKGAKDLAFIGQQIDK